MTIWDIAFEPRLRVIIDTDAKNEADDQFASVHALLSPSLDVRGLIAAHFGDHRTTRSMQESREEIDLLVRLLGIDGVRIENGATCKLSDPSIPLDSPGARLIVQEAMRDDAGPLVVALLGPLTDMAAALLLAPEIAARDLTVIWIGGAPYEGLGAAYAPEFNLSNSSQLQVWQVPMSTYVMMSVSYAELYEKVMPCGEIGEYLVRQLIEFNQTHRRARTALEFRSLGDSPAIGLMLNPHCGWWSERPAVGFNADCTYDLSKEFRPIRVYHSIDNRFILSDFFSKLKGFMATRNRPDPVERPT